MKNFAVILILLVGSSFAAESPKLEAGTLIIFRLTVESSYAQGIERPASKRFDTVQWWIGPNGAWRIKTYAIDSDIHPYRLETKAPAEELQQLALTNTQKTYGDVVGKKHIVKIPPDASLETVRRLLRDEGLRDSAEWVTPGYLLWLPDDSRYTTRTKPKKP
ncbi:MAG: hypothetical protein JNL39_07995 [Opitutaceae bacterium]|nr:hypothetical protein [Opitutaceae bacterium]